MDSAIDERYRTIPLIAEKHKKDDTFQKAPRKWGESFQKRVTDVIMFSQEEAKKSFLLSYAGPHVYKG